MNPDFKEMIILFPIIILLLTLITSLIFLIFIRNYNLNLFIIISGILISIFFISNNEIRNTDINSLINIDKYSIFFTLIILILSIILSILSYNWIYNFPGNREEYFLLLIISIIGGILLTCSQHFFMVIISLELLSIPLFGMISFGYDNKYYLESAIKYILLSIISSSFLFFGVSLIYADSGKLSFREIFIFLNTKDPYLFSASLAGIILILISFCFKLSLFPFHIWAPEVYQNTPIPITFFLYTIKKIAIFAVMLKFFTFPILEIRNIKFLLKIISIFSILFGSIMSINQLNLKRLLGYSSITNSGYLLIILLYINNNNISIESIIIYFITYMFNSIGLFSIMSLLTDNYQLKYNSNYNLMYKGIFWKNSIITLLLTIIILSLAGFPLTLGFIFKYYIIYLLVYEYSFWLLLFVLITNVINIYFYFKIIVKLYLRPKNILSKHDSISLLSKSIIFNIIMVIIFLCCFTILIFGLCPQLIIKLSTLY